MRNKDILEVLDRMLSYDEQAILPIFTKEKLLLFLKDWEEEVMEQYSYSPYGIRPDTPTEKEIELIWKNKEEIFGKESIDYMNKNSLLQENNIHELSLLFFKDILYSELSSIYILGHLKTVYEGIPLVILFRLSKLLEQHFEESLRKFNTIQKAKAIGWAGMASL